MQAAALVRRRVTTLSHLCDSCRLDDTSRLRNRLSAAVSLICVTVVRPIHFLDFFVATQTLAKQNETPMTKFDNGYKRYQYPADVDQGGLPLGIGGQCATSNGRNIGATLEKSVAYPPIRRTSPAAARSENDISNSTHCGPDVAYRAKRTQFTVFLGNRKY